MRQFGPTPGAFPDIAVTPFGRVYVTTLVDDAYPNVTHLGGDDWLVVRFERTGLIEQQFTLGSSENELVPRIDEDPQGNIVVGGGTAGIIGNEGYGEGDAAAVRSSASGEVTQTVQKGTTEHEAIQGIAVDNSGSILVAGDTTGDLGALYAGGGDAFVAKIAGSPAADWLVQFGSDDADLLSAVTSNTANDVFAAGFACGDIDGNSSNGACDMFVVKYSSQGVRAWTRLAGSQGYDFAYGVTATLDGGAVLVGTAEGAVGTLEPIGSDDVVLLKYTANGQIEWWRRRGTDVIDTPRAIFADSEHNIIVVGDSNGDLDSNLNNGDSDAFVMKFNASGEWLWTRLIGTTSAETCGGGAADPAGNIFIVGTTSGNFANNEQPGRSTFVAKLSADGTLQ